MAVTCGHIFLSSVRPVGRIKCRNHTLCPAKSRSPDEQRGVKRRRRESYKRLSAISRSCTGRSQIYLKNSKTMVQVFHGNVPSMRFCSASKWRRFVNSQYPNSNKETSPLPKPWRESLPFCSYPSLSYFGCGRGCFAPKVTFWLVPGCGKPLLAPRTFSASILYFMHNIEGDYKGY